MSAKYLLLSAAIMGSSSLVAGREVPSNLQALYNLASSKRCENPLSAEFEDGHGASKWTPFHGNPSYLYKAHVYRQGIQLTFIPNRFDADGLLKLAGFVYCGDQLDQNGIVYLSGPSDSKPLADMDIDCDGANHTEGDCEEDKTGQAQTAFKYIVRDYGIEDLDSNKHSFVVFGNEGHSPSHMPTEYGVDPLSVVAIVCNNKLFYGVWGDTNGGTVVGETSISLAQACYPNGGITGDHGHSESDVLYVMFPGDNNPGRDGAAWNAGDFSAFEESLSEMGDRLVADIQV